MAIITTTFQIDIGKDNTNTDASIELDGRKDGFNEGKTEFRGGDTIYFLLRVPPNTIIDEIVTNEGSAVEYTSDVLDVTDKLLFDYPSELSQRLSRTPNGTPSMRWIGKGLPVNPTFDDSTGEAILPNPSSLKNPLAPTQKPKRALGLLKCTYTEKVRVIQLTTPKTVDNNPIYSIHGVIAGHIKDVVTNK